MKLAPCTLFFAVCLSPVWGQVAQSNSYYCGLPGDVNPSLTDVSATVDRTNSRAELFIGRGSSAKSIRLEDSLISEIAEVCPLSDGRLVVFADFGGTQVYVIDRAKASVLDSFTAWWPAMSPDQRWIVYRKFFPLHGVAGSDEYLIYDLAKTQAENRPNGDVREMMNVGSVIYPPGQGNFTGSNIDLPEEQQHGGGLRMYWAADSRAILFEDRLPSSPGVALVILDDNGAPTALRHVMTLAETCGPGLAGVNPYDWRLDRAEVGEDQGGSRSILLHISPVGNSRCPPHVVPLNSRDDFHPAKTEKHVWQKPTHRSVVSSDPPILHLK